jgi:hypothetical protein
MRAFTMVDSLWGTYEVKRTAAMIAAIGKEVVKAEPASSLKTNKVTDLMSRT